MSCAVALKDMYAKCIQTHANANINQYAALIIKPTLMYYRCIDMRNSEYLYGLFYEC